MFPHGLIFIEIQVMTFQSDPQLTKQLESLRSQTSTAAPGVAAVLEVLDNGTENGHITRRPAMLSADLTLPGGSNKCLLPASRRAITAGFGLKRLITPTLQAKTNMQVSI